MSSCRLLSFAVACFGLVVASSAPLCPCPDDKWQPPFRPSQVLYSEFPEDRGRSLDIDRKDVSRKGYPPSYPSYDPLLNNRLPDDPEPRDYSDEYPAGGGGGGGSPPDKDYSSQYSGPGAHPDQGGPIKDYTDYPDSSSRERPPPSSAEYTSSEASQGHYKEQYSSYDYRDDKSKEDVGEGEPDFSLEDFSLDPAVMNPPPPLVRSAKSSSLRNSSHPPPRQPPPPRSRPHDEVHEPTEPPTTQLELPATLPSVPQLPAPALPIQATGYPLTRTPVPVFRNPVLSLMTPNQPGWGHWKNVLDQVELSNLQVMKPPPLGQAQTWGRLVNNNNNNNLNNNFAATSKQYGKRAPLRYA